jgi:hypothetical protein
MEMDLRDAQCAKAPGQMILRRPTDSNMTVDRDEQSLNEFLPIRSTEPGMEMVFNEIQ